MKLKSFQSGASGVEKALARMGDSFSGRRVLQEASLAVKAVEDLGGVSRLTASEQQRLNSIVDEAIAKYRALGLEVPSSLKAVQSATSSWRSSLQQINGLLGAFGASLSLGALVAFGRELLQTGDELVKVADRTGLTTEEVQKLQFIAGQSGNSLDEMTAAISSLQRNLVVGDKSAVQAVKALGLNLQELKSQTPFDQMALIADAIGRIPNPADRAAVAIQLFGKSGAAILPTLTAQFKALGNEAPVMSDKTARALDKAGDALAKFGTQIKVWAAESYNFAGRLFDNLTKFAFQAAAAVLNATASLAQALTKLPGGSKVLDAMGVSIDGLRREAQYFTDAAGAMQAQLDHVDVAVRKVVPPTLDLEQATKSSGAAVKEAVPAWDQYSQAMTVTNDTARALGDQLNKVKAQVFDTGQFISGVGAGILKAKDNAAPGGLIAGIVGDIPKLGREAGVSWAGGFQAGLSGIGDSLVRAFEGGGNVLKSIGSSFGLNFTQHTFGSDAFKKLIGDKFGSALGGMFNAVLPGIGALAGPLLSKIGDLFKNIFNFGGPSKQEQQGRSLSDQFTQQLAGMLDWQQQIEVHQLIAAGNSEKFATQLVAIRDNFRKVGLSADDTNDVINRLWQAEKQGGNAVQVVIDEIITKFHTEVPDAAAITENAGVSAFEAIATAVDDVNDKLKEQYTQMLKLRGFTGGSAGDGSSEGKNQSDILRGLSADDARRAYESVIAPGSTDQDWNRVKDQYGFSRGGIVPKYYLGGGYARGTDTVPAMLTPGEVVLNAAQQRNVAGALNGGGLTIAIGDISCNYSEADITNAIISEMRRRGVRFKAA